jgi:replicative DNA helicase
MSAADEVRDEAVEAAVLACLLNGARVDDVPAPPEAFTTPARRQVYEACLAALRRLMVVDVATVRSELELAKAPADTVEMVEALACATIRREHFPRYVDGLLDFYARRTAIRAMEAGIRDVCNPKARVDAVAGKVVGVLGSLGAGRDEAKGGEDVRAILSDYRDIGEAIEQKREPRPAFLPSPFAGHGGGISPFRGYPAKKGVSCLGVVAGRSGNGKTARLATMLHFWICRMKKKGGLFGLEDGTRWLVERWIARDFGMSWGDVGSAYPENAVRWHRDVPWLPREMCTSPGVTQDYFQTEVTFLNALDCYERILDDRLMRHAAGGIAAPQLLAKCRRWIDDGAEFIVIDHGLRVDYSPGKDERLDRAIGRNIDRLADLTVDTGIPIIVAWHLNRTSDDASPPVMGDLKESGYLDATASVIEGQWRVKGVDGGPDRTFSNTIKSRRSGGLGRIIEMAWGGESGMMDPERCVEVNLAAEHAAKKAAQKAAGKGFKP